VFGPFRDLPLRSRMAGPLKANSDASDSDGGLKAVNKVIKLTRVGPPREEGGHGTIDQLGCTTSYHYRIAKAADAGRRSAVRYDA
jgi:hypothetical protein